MAEREFRPTDEELDTLMRTAIDAAWENPVSQTSTSINIFPENYVPPSDEELDTLMKETINEAWETPPHEPAS